MAGGLARTERGRGRDNDLLLLLRRALVDERDGVSQDVNLDDIRTECPLIVDIPSTERYDDLHESTLQHLLVKCRFDAVRLNVKGG